MTDVPPTGPVSAAKRSHSRAVAHAELAGAPVRPKPLTPGTKLGRFEIRRLMGVGGTSAVFVAHDTDAGRDVALKVLATTADVASDARLRRAFVAEAKALATLRHPGIVRVFDVGVAGRHPVLSMELVQGPTFARWREATRPGPRAVVRTITALCSAVAAAHAAGIVHRDIKPTNVVVCNGRPVLLDFGLARAADGTGTASSVVVGSRGFIAPERLEGDAGGPPADQFALAALAQFGLHGAAPGDDSAPPANGVQRVIARGLSTDPADRFPSVQAFGSALARAHRRPYVLAAIGIAVLVAAVGWRLAS